MVLTFCFSTAAWAHKNHHHGEKASADVKKKSAEALIQIREEYKRRVAPIFERSCMDCHGSHTRYPWYYKIPGIKQKIDSDINESKEHLDMSDGYPFKSHESPIDDLEEIAESIEKGEMPPLLYGLMHRDSALSENEKKIISDWVKSSVGLLRD